jgi:MYXO-CTERM domain-containing protein
MRALVPAAMLAAVLLQARAAWACGECVGEGGGSALGWMLIGAVALLGYRWISRR